MLNKNQKLKKIISTENILPKYHFKKVKVKKGLAGMGLYADEFIKKGSKIIQYVGDILTDKECENMKDDGERERYIFWIKKDHNIDGYPKWNIARYANHSCDGNSESQMHAKEIYLFATKNIQAGEEITFDYGEEYVKEFLFNKCMCGAKKHLYH